MKKLYALLIINLSLSGCAVFSSHKYRKISIPKVPIIQKPGGNTNSWHYIGTTSNGQVVDEINNSSIIQHPNNFQIYNFQDRKTIINSATFNYSAGQTHFKFLISNWQMDCTNKLYLLVLATMYNDSGILISKNDYTYDNSMRWEAFGSGSFAEMQYNYICLNQKHNLGY